MKVMVLSPPLKPFGGVQAFTQTLVRALEQVNGPHSSRLIAVRPRIDALRTDAKMGWWPKAALLSAALSMQMFWRANLCICSHVGLARVGRLLRSVFGCPYWVVAHGIEVWGNLSSTSAEALLGADRILAVSEFTRGRLIDRHRAPGDKVMLFPNALDPDLVAVLADRERGEVLPRETKVVLTVGRLSAHEQYKGQDTVIRALPAVRKRFPRVVYWIVGDGDDRARLEALSREMGVEDRVVFHGHLDRAELSARYRSCDVFALPARTELDDRTPRGEGFGIVFLEAMAHGKPVVGPKVGAPAEFLRTGEYGLLVDPTDPASISRALIDLLEDPARAKRMGMAAQEWVTQEFGFERFCRRLQEILMKNDCRMIS